MSIQFNTESCPFKFSNNFLKVLESVLCNSARDVSCENCLTFVFRDESYSAETGGYHPVEIRLIKVNEKWTFDYITDFTFVGSGYNAELTKEIDFDFANDYGFHLYTGELELRKLSELYKIWESNFVSYVEMKVFQVKVTAN